MLKVLGNDEIYEGLAFLHAFTVSITLDDSAYRHTLVAKFIESYLNKSYVHLTLRDIPRLLSRQDADMILLVDFLVDAYILYNPLPLRRAEKAWGDAFLAAPCVEIGTNPGKRVTAKDLLHKYTNGNYEIIASQSSSAAGDSIQKNEHSGNTKTNKGQQA